MIQLRSRFQKSKNRKPPDSKQRPQLVLLGMEAFPISENKVIDLSSARADVGQEWQADPED